MTTKEIIAQGKKNQILNANPTARQVAEYVVADALAPLVKQLTEKVEATLVSLKGETGRQGEKGDQGECGSAGQRGDVGPQGVPGYDGKDGRDGQDGKDGVSGENGKDGKDGSPDTADQIATKLNTLTESLDFGVIRGLKTWMTNLQRSVKEKHGGGKSGGGMGNTVHESYAVNSTTTFVTVTQHIAANGFAAWVFYQGQMIVRGSTWSVFGGKQINLLFTPQDNTNIDIVYIRT